MTTSNPRRSASKPATSKLTVCTVPSISFIFTRLRLSRNYCTFCANSRARLISLKIASAEKSTFRFLDAILERPGNNNTLYATTPLRPLRYYYNLPFYFLYYVTTSSRTIVSKIYLIKRASHVRLHLLRLKWDTASLRGRMNNVFPPLLKRACVSRCSCVCLELV